MKKSILLALSVALCATAFAACEQPEAHAHTWSDWKSDANAHWKETTCEAGAHTDVYKKDFAVHNDADADGDCDDCGYVLCNHVNNDAGICTLCGYGTPDVSDIAKAIAVAKVQNSVVKYGELVDFGESKQTYAFKDGYTYVNDADINYEYYFSLDAAGEPFGVSVTTYAGEYEMITSESAYANVQKDNLYGAELAMYYLDVEDVVFCGAFGIVNNLYDLAKEDLNEDFTESVADGVYSFSFGFYADGWDPSFYVTKVDFKLDATNYYISEVTVTRTEYTGEAIVENVQEDESVLYSVAAEAEATSTSVATVKQYAEEKADVNPYKPADLTVTSYKVVDASGAEVTALNLEKGYDTVLYVAETLPETASMNYAVVEFSGDNVNGEDWFTSLSANYYDGEITLSTPATVGTTFALKVSVNGVEKTINVTVVDPVPTSIEAGYAYVDEYETVYFEASAEEEIWAGESLLIGALLDKNVGGYTVTAKDKDNADVTLTEGETYQVYTDAYVDVVTYDVSMLEAGEYTITFTSVADATLSSTMTLTIKAVPSPADILNGTYTYKMIEEEDYNLGQRVYTIVSITFSNVQPGFMFAGDATIKETMSVVEIDWWGNEYEEVYNRVLNEQAYQFGYSPMNNTFQWQQYDYDATVAYQFSINEDYELCFGIVDVEYEPMEKEEVTAASAIVGEWIYKTTETYTHPGNDTWTCTWTYGLTFNSDGTVTIVYDGWVEGMIDDWHNSDDKKTYTCAYTVAETAEAGVYAITFSALPGAGECTVTGFALTNACSIVDGTFDSVSLVIDGTAQTFTK